MATQLSDIIKKDAHRRQQSTKCALFRSSLHFSPGVIEQGFVSLLNFGAVFVFSKALPEHVFADYVVAYAGLGLATTLCVGGWGLPALVFASSQYSNAPARYLSMLKKGNAISSALLSSAILLTLTIFVQKLSVATLVTGVLLSVAWTNYDVLRRFSHATQTVGALVLRSGLLLSVFAMMVVTVFTVLTPSAPGALLCLAIAYIVAGIKPTRKKGNGAGENISGRDVLSRHWNYAKWPLLGIAGYWTYTHGIFLLGALLLTDIQLGAFRAIHNLLGAASILFLVYENYQTPRVTRRLAAIAESKSSLRTLWKQAFAGGSLILTPACLGVTGAVFLAFPFLYGDQYSGYRFLIFLMGLYQLLLALSRVPVVFLRARQHTVFFAYAHWGAAFVAVSTGCTFYSVTGLTVAIVLASAVFLGTMLVGTRISLKPGKPVS